MANLLSRFFQRLSPRRDAPSKAPPPGSPRTAAEAPAPGQDPALQKLPEFTDEQLRDYLSGRPERAVVRLLQTLDSDALRLRILRFVADELTLKRVARSELPKKLRRAAERRLRETGSAAISRKLHGIAETNQKIQAFLNNPDWSRAREILELTRSAELEEDGEEDNQSGPRAELLALRGRLESEIASYEKTCSEMEALCDELASSPPKPRAELDRIHERWADLQERYRFPPGFKILERYAQLVEARRLSSQKPHSPRSKALKSPSLETERSKKEALEQERENKAQAARDERRSALDRLLGELNEMSGNVTRKGAGARLRRIQGELTALRRWKREFPARLDEAEALLKALSGKRAEAIQEARWDTWAKTDLATRIQAELEKTLLEIEAETDPAAAAKRAEGLGGKLLEAAREMRGFGSLDRARDREIWEKFKSQTDRGWAICDRMREQVLNSLKATLSTHFSKPIDEVVTLALGDSRAPLPWRATAFEPEPADRVQKLHVQWREIGSRPSEANRDVEKAGARLFEAYFRSLNSHLGRLQRAEAQTIHQYRALLDQMKIACEGKSTLVSRAKVAKRYEEQWAKESLPESVATALQAELESCQVRLNTELDTEMEKQVASAEELLNQARSRLSPVLSGEAADLTQVRKSISALESGIKEHDEKLRQLEALRQRVGEAVAGASPPMRRFEEIRTDARALAQDCREAITRQITRRTQLRDQLLAEAEELAISTDLEAARARFEEIRALWKTVGVLGHKDDSLFGLILENAWAFLLKRIECRRLSPSEEESARCRAARRDLLCSLDALTRFQAMQAPPLPFPEEERVKASARVLDFGLKYKQILSLDPQGGKLKETRKIMEQWSRLGLPDSENLEAFWRYYSDRVHTLLLTDGAH